MPYSTLTLETEARSQDGTVKALFRTADGHPVETVLMRYRDGRRSLCLSSQSGCPLTCSFCATGAMRFGRNLTSSEVLDQALHFRRHEPVDHAVFMGMGEPMLNLDPVLAAARRAPRSRDHAPQDDDLHRRLAPGPPPLRGRGRRADPPRALAARTRGRAPFRADGGQRPLSAGGRRRRVPPLRRATRAQGLRRVRHARRRQRHGRPGARSRSASAPRRSRSISSRTTRPAASKGSSREAIAAFRAALVRSGVPATVRLTRGRDIEAACGRSPPPLKRRAPTEVSSAQDRAPFVTVQLQHRCADSR